MLEIKRTVNGKEMTFLLTGEEIKEVSRQNNIQWAKDILSNYSDIIIDYDNIIQNEEKLQSYSELMESKNLEDNGDKELKTIEELFQTREDY